MNRASVEGSNDLRPGSNGFRPLDATVVEVRGLRGSCYSIPHHILVNILQYCCRVNAVLGRGIGVVYATVVPVKMTS
jgi:hypothetical protein